MIGYFSTAVIDVQVSEVTFSTEGASSIAITANSVAKKARSKATFANVLTSSSWAGKGRSTAQVSYRVYPARTFAFGPLEVPVSQPGIDYDRNYKFVVGSQSIAGKARSSIPISIPVVIESFSIAGKARSSLQVFLPPFEVVAVSVTKKPRTAGFVGVPYLVEANSRGYKARSSAFLQEQRAITADSRAKKARSSSQVGLIADLEISSGSVAHKARSFAALQYTLSIEATSIGHKARSFASISAAATRKRRILVVTH